MKAKPITIQGFLDEFRQQHLRMNDRSFCFILGAGASVQSGISSGAQLVQQWLQELHVREHFGRMPLDQWATAQNLDILGFDYQKAASFYPEIFMRRFQDDPETGYAFLEDAMNDKEPSYGYIVVAQILSKTRHKVVITTNFDNLVADALSIYTRTFPLICGHESLASFVRSQLRRPLIAKIHRDLLLAPINTPEGTAALAPGWVKALTDLLQFYTPIVIGYGGNDGSLMNFLVSLEKPIKGGIFWCHRANDNLDERVHEVVVQHRGKLVPIVGFDEIMLLLQEQLVDNPNLCDLQHLPAEIESRARRRIGAYRKQFETLLAKVKEPGSDDAAERAKEPVREAVAAAVERTKTENDWWAWELKAQAESDPVKRKAIYGEGVKNCPNSAELIGNFALFMETTRNHDEAERLYRKALELDPNRANITGNFALFVETIRKNYDEAERLYRKALELDPNHASNTGNFALFMEKIRKNYDEAERLYRKALELDPNLANITGNFALFMEKIRKNYDEAERLYRKALELDPNRANITGNFALFMETIRKNYDEAERLYRKALELDPNLADITGNFALFTETIRKNYDEAERLYRKALKLRPFHANNTGNFALFMEKIRQNYDEAERMYRSAWELDPNLANITGNFALFMEKIRRNYDKAERLYREALEIDPNHANNARNFANFMKTIRK